MVFALCRRRALIAPLSPSRSIDSPIGCGMVPRAPLGLSIDLEVYPPSAAGATLRLLPYIASDILSHCADVTKQAYNGNKGLDLIKQAWPANLAGRDLFIKDFLSRLRHSQFWNSIAELNCWKH